MRKQLIELQNGLLIHYSEFLDGDTANRLLQQLTEETPWRQDRIRLFGKEHLIPRQQAFQGDPDLSYRYSGLSLAAQPWHPAIAQLRPTLDLIADTDFNCVLLNQYRDGQDSMGWHSDDEPELGPDPVIASLSLGARRRFRLRHRTDRTIKPVALELDHGDLLIMAGSTQHFWHHSLPRTKRVDSPRINLTFRKITTAAP